jgi:hypothetical protein
MSDRETCAQRLLREAPCRRLAEDGVAERVGRTQIGERDASKMRLTQTIEPMALG